MIENKYVKIKTIKQIHIIWLGHSKMRLMDFNSFVEGFRECERWI